MNTLRLALLSLAALVAIFLGWTYLHQPATSTAGSQRGRTSPQEVAAMRRAIERNVAGATDYAGFFDRLKIRLPGRI